MANLQGRPISSNMILKGRKYSIFLLIYLLASLNVILTQHVDDGLDLPGMAGSSHTAGEYYDGNRPAPTPDFDAKASSISGIRLYDFGGLPQTDYCISSYIGGSQTCIYSCGTPSGGSNFRDCSCDSTCYFNNDCCLDYEIYCADGWIDLEGSTNEPLSTEPSATVSGNATIEHSYSTHQPLYVDDHKQFYDDMDLFRTYIPNNVKVRLINDKLLDTCFVPSIGSDFPYLMISECPKHSSATEHKQCSNHTWNVVDSMVPVYSNSSGLFYSNKFCAACHGFTIQLEFMTLSCEWTCSGHLSPYLDDAPQTVDDCQKSRCFSLKWVYDSNPPRRCHPVKANCPFNESDPISTACHSYSAYVFGGEGSEENIYKNVHCAYCNNINKTRNKCDGTYYKDGRGESDFGITGDQVPLTILFDFSGGALQQSQSFGGPEPPMDCLDYFLYDRGSQECRRVSCPPGAVLFDYQCVFDQDQSQVKPRSLSNALDPTYRRLVIEIASNDSDISDEQIREFLHGFWYINQHIQLYSIEKRNMSEEPNEGMKINWNGETWVKSNYPNQEEDCGDSYQIKYIVNLEGNFESAVDHGIISVQNWLKQRPRCQPVYPLDFALIRVSFFNFPNVMQLCASNYSYQVPKSYGARSFSRRYNESSDDFQIEMYFPDDDTIAYDSVKVPQEIVFAGSRLYQNTYDEDLGNWSRTDLVYLCENGPICPLITLSSEEYQWEFGEDNTASLILLTSGKQVPDDEIVLSYDGLVQICLIIEESVPFYAYSSGQTLATTIGCVVSLTLLALVIITYCTFPSLRNVPGKTVLSLSISLFLAQLLLLVGAGQTEHWELCLTIACVLHIAWLSVFSWTNILAFDLAKTFGKKSGIRGDDSGNTCFIKYSLYAWGTPIGIVGITVLLHFVHEVDGKLRNIYGLTSACWLRSGHTLFIAFGVPVAVALIVDTVHFVYTVLGIRATMKIAKILKKDHERCDDMDVLKKELKLYIRLSICVGLTWISGFIIPYTGVVELGYLFIILNSLQGPVIFLSFICSHRVMKLWSNKLGSGVSLLSSSMDRSTAGSVAVSRTMQTQVNGRSAIYEDRNV